MAIGLPPIQGHLPRPLFWLCGSQPPSWSSQEGKRFGQPGLSGGLAMFWVIHQQPAWQTRELRLLQCRRGKSHQKNTALAKHSRVSLGACLLHASAQVSHQEAIIRHDSSPDATARGAHSSLARVFSPESSSSSWPRHLSP